MMKVYIYLLHDPLTEEVRYVGLTRFPARRLSNEINYPHTKHFANWINLLKRNGTKPRMEIVDETEEGLACEVERKWIADMRSRGCRLLNYTNGGEGGWTLSEEQRRAISIARKGKKSGPMSPEHKAAIGRGNKGKKCPWSAGNFIKLNKSRKGIPLSESTKTKLSQIGKQRLKGEWLERFIQGNKDRIRPSKVTDRQKSEIKRLLIEGYSYKVVADTYGLSGNSMGDVKNNKIWAKTLPAEHDFVRPANKSMTFNCGKYARAQGGEPRTTVSESG